MAFVGALSLELDPHVHEVAMPSTVVSWEKSAVEAARRGDPKACEHLCHRYVGMVHGLLLARVPFREVDDLVQDVFLHALERLNTLRDPDAFGSWLAMIARNKAHDYYRKTKTTETVSDEILENRSGEPDHHTEAVRVMMIIRSVPEAYRETLALRLIEGMTGPEIAECTGMTPDSVRVNLHRGMKLLREKLGMKP
jgi:RNA polymerase sigma-70 factor (ECF subfamily)